MIDTDVAFEPSRLHPQPDLFTPFQTTDVGLPLHKARLPASAELIVFERQGQRRALLTQEMAYHHLTQGDLADTPYMVSFCGVCHSGVGLTPVINGQIHHFRAGGLYNGVVILQDDETGTYWDHITGRAVAGPLQGHQLEIWGVEMTTVAAARQQEPQLKVLRSHQRPLFRSMMGLGTWIFQHTGYLPKLFTQTMAPEDPRLPRMTLGLGVVVQEQARFYPQNALHQPLTETFNGQPLTIAFNPNNGVPFAQWQDGTQPLQYFLRWYGFALTFPQCSLYRPDVNPEDQ